MGLGGIDCMFWRLGLHLVRSGVCNLAFSWSKLSSGLVNGWISLSHVDTAVF